MTEDMAYIARRPCGCLCAAMVDSPEHRKDTADFVAELVRDGHVVERLPIEATREGPWSCPKCRKPNTAGTLFDPAITERTEAQP